MLLNNTNQDIAQFSPGALSFVGDGVYSLLVREYLISRGNRPSGELHAMSVKMVNAAAQSQAYHLIKDLLSGTETAVFKRGRNAKTNNTPKGSSEAEYHNATGMEALFGHLYLSGQIDRLIELFDIICE